MARKLKTYLTSQGYFDLAIAAPSMKAALEAWGSNINLFHKGFAKEADDPEIVAATMARPGVILKRPVGSNEPFQENARLPSDLPATKPERKAEKPGKKLKEQPPDKVDDKTARKAALAFEQQQRKRESERRKQEAAEAEKRERRQRAIAKAEAALDKAKREHETKVGMIGKERAELEKRAQAEEDRWEKLKERLETALRRAGD
jgi:colicin import membrane protein